MYHVLVRTDEHRLIELSIGEPMASIGQEVICINH